MKFTRDRLVSSGLAQEAALDAMDGDITAEMDATIDFTVESKAPPLTSMFKDVYAVGEPEPEPVRTRIDRVLSKDEA